MHVAAPDPDEFFDRVLAVSDPGIHRLGPARTHQAQWWAAAQETLRGAAGGPADAAVQLAAHQGLVITREGVRRSGVPDPVIRSLLRSGAWSRPRYGVLSPLARDPANLAAHPAAVAVSPHGLASQVRAAAAALVRPGTVVSHESALLMHGLPVLGLPPRPVLSSVNNRQVSGRPDLLVHCVGIRPREVAEWFGAPVTDVARAIIDVSRASGVGAGLVAADAALFDGLVTHADLARARTDAGYRPGVTNVDRVVRLADGRAESPLESLTRLCLVEGGLAVPLLQQWVSTHRGRYRVDMLYPSRRVIIECDGELKYRGDDPVPFVEEKRRHEALVRAGFVVVRVSWSDIRDDPADVIFRVGAALFGYPTPGSR